MQWLCEEARPGEELPLASFLRALQASDDGGDAVGRLGKDTNRVLLRSHTATRARCERHLARCERHLPAFSRLVKRATRSVKRATRSTDAQSSDSSVAQPASRSPSATVQEEQPFVSLSHSMEDEVNAAAGAMKSSIDEMGAAAGAMKSSMARPREITAAAPPASSASLRRSRSAVSMLVSCAAATSRRRALSSSDGTVSRFKNKALTAHLSLMRAGLVDSETVVRRNQVEEMMASLIIAINCETIQLKPREVEGDAASTMPRLVRVHPEVAAREYELEWDCAPGTPSGACVATGKAVMVANALLDAASFPALRRSSVYFELSQMHVPVVRPASAEVAGVLTLLNKISKSGKRAGLPFTERDKATVRTSAALIASTLFPAPPPPSLPPAASSQAIAKTRAEQREVAKAGVAEMGVASEATKIASRVAAVIAVQRSGGARMEATIKVEAEVESSSEDASDTRTSSVSAHTGLSQGGGGFGAKELRRRCLRI